ncbi:MAG: hypothetical protein U0P30_00075 [Vicinamibacterales bacterium]
MRVPTISFTVEGIAAPDAVRQIDPLGIGIRYGDFHRAGSSIISGCRRPAAWCACRWCTTTRWRKWTGLVAGLDAVIG